MLQRFVSSVLVLMTCVLSMFASAVFAEPPGNTAFQLPPPPSQHAATWGTEFSLTWLIPLERAGVCPSADAPCLLGVGAAFGAGAHWEFSRLFTLRGGYELAFLGGSAVFEIATMQSILIGGRFSFLERSKIHPLIGVDIGVVGIGDTFRIDAAGGVVEVGVGADAELSPSSSVTIYAFARSFATGDFLTRDEELRGNGVAPNLFFGLRVVISVHAERPMFRD